MKSNKPLYIYLDQNKWLDLARARYNRPDGNKFKAVLQKIIGAVESKKAILPLSSVHIVETHNRTDIPSRDRLAKAMATISQGWAIAFNENTVRREMQISGSKIFGYAPPNPPNMFGRGLNFALGIDTRSVIIKGIDDPLASSDDFLHSFNEVVSSPLIMNYFCRGA